MYFLRAVRKARVDCNGNPVFFPPGFGFFAYESLKDFILAMNGALTKVNKEDQAVLTSLGGLMCGAFAGASSQTVA